jgi:hypothetical protein
MQTSLFIGLMVVLQIYEGAKMLKRCDVRTNDRPIPILLVEISSFLIGNQVLPSIFHLLLRNGLANTF